MTVFVCIQEQHYFGGTDRQIIKIVASEKLAEKWVEEQGHQGGSFTYFYEEMEVEE